MCDMRLKDIQTYCFKLNFESHIVSKDFFLVGTHMSTVLMSLVPRWKCFKTPYVGD